MSEAAAKNWFDVDRKGLAKLMERRGGGSGGGNGNGKIWLLHELIANSWDADGTTRVDVTLTPEDGAPKVWITVTDDAPDGFTDLRHSWTLFAESNRKSDAGKRGRFNLGEKLVLALCDEATIVTTTAGVMFDQRGRTTMRQRRDRGSEFTGLAKITRAELAEIMAGLKQLIPPPGIETFINGELLASRIPLKMISATLPTEISDADGILRRTSRKCDVAVYEPLAGETAMLYELGIPVVETGDRWHVSVSQKVPLNFDRDNVTPAYLREMRTLIVNAMHEQLTEDDANSTFVNEALASPDASPETVVAALDLKFGKKRATWDPSDLEANMNVVASGHTLIKGAQLSKAQWENVRKHGAARPAGQIAPTPKVVFSIDGEDFWVPREKWTPSMVKVIAYAWDIAANVLGYEINVGILDAPHERYLACFGGKQLTFNLGRLGHGFFDACTTGPTVALNELLIHELAHSYASNHLDEKFHEACCQLGAKLVTLALIEPVLFTWKL